MQYIYENYLYTSTIFSTPTLYEKYGGPLVKCIEYD